MPQADRYVKELAGINEKLEKLGDEFVEHFPRSSSLYRFVGELSTAQQGLQALYQELQKAVQVADNENKMKQDLMLQIKQNPIYSKLDDGAKNRLAEYLVQQGTPLATEEDLLSFAVKSIKGQSVENIVKNLSKEFVMQLGGQPAGGGDSNFDAYSAGVKAIEDMMASPEEADKFVGVLAREYLRREPVLTIRRFYDKVTL